MHLNGLGAALLLAAMTLPPATGAIPEPTETITRNNVRQAELKAKSAEDHKKIAQYYQHQTELMRAKLAEAEDLVKYWSLNAVAIEDSKTPNPYWSAKQRAEGLRVELESASAHAAEQQRLAQSAR
jgi:hypothetical protein